ncbi:MAG TPA: hypothetical protein VGF13_02160, partial [Verrucomicrobiae bacterium]
FEEYRGFFEVNAAGVQPRHRRTSPNNKDVFAFSNVQDIDAAMTDLGLGYLLDPAGGASDLGLSGVRVHRIDNNQWLGGPTIMGIYYPARELNFNRAGIAGAARQCAIFVDQTLRTGFTDLGVARGGINTGPNGVCNTLVPNGGNMAVRLDFQVIPRNQGFPNQPALRPSANGIIDPHVEAGDQLNFNFNPPRIVSATADNALHTLTLPTGVNANGYVPDDRVRGNIRGLNGLLNHATVAAIRVNDVLRGEIREGADNKLEVATVLNASVNDSLANVVLDPNGNGFQTAIDPRDIANGGGTVSGGQNNGGFFTVNILGNDIFRGRIVEGGDNVLDSRPANANDVVAGTVEEGADNKLESRPAHANDKVVGFVEDGGNGFLDPTLNDAAANIAGSAAVAAPNDDVYDHATRTVMTGPDGIRNTNPQAGADDEPVIAAAGNGTPFAYCIDPDNRNNNDEGNTDDVIQTAAAGDDIASNGNDPGLARGGNSDVNDCAYAYVPVTHPLGAPVAPNTRNLFDANQNVFQINPPPANKAARVNFDCRVAAVANDGRRQELLKQTIGHESGHCMHLEHYFNTATRQPDGTWRLFGGGGHGISGSVIMSGVNNTVLNGPGGVGVLPLSRVFDNVDLPQIRLHQKHP